MIRNLSLMHLGIRLLVAIFSAIVFSTGRDTYVMLVEFENGRVTDIILCQQHSEILPALYRREVKSALCYAMFKFCRYRVNGVWKGNVS